VEKFKTLQEASRSKSSIDKYPAMKKEVFNKRVKSARKLQATQKPIRTVSKSKLLVKVLYRNAVAEFLANLPQEKQICPVLLRSVKIVCATEVHHTRGRLGKLLLDKRYWLAVSAEGHRWIHDHPDEVRAHGWLCAKGDWNKQP
jgi:hypothetical protein